MRGRSYYFDPLNQLGRLLYEINELFDDTMGSRVEYPLVNMWSNEEEIVLRAEIPGVKVEDLQINVLEDTLTIQGKREAPKKVEYHREERPKGSFKRVFKLPYKVQEDKVTAKYEKGVLTITLPRSEKEKPKQIKVMAS